MSRLASDASLSGPLDITVVGTGMYVVGRGTDGFGTVLPAIAEWTRHGGEIRRVRLVGTNAQNARTAAARARELARITGIDLPVEAYPESGNDAPGAYRDLLNTAIGPACAVVVVPDHLHHAVVKDCLNAGLHTLVVKPFTVTVEEGRELVELAASKRLYGAVEFHKRWDRANLLLRDAIRNGDLGDPLYCWVEYSQKKSVPLHAFRAWASQTTVLQYLGVHYIDVVRFVTGAEPRSVVAVGQKHFLASQGIDTYDSMQCVVQWEAPSGHRFSQTLLMNWIDPEESTAMSDQKITLVGTNGRFESDQKDRGIRITRDGTGVEEPNPDFCRPYGPEGTREWRGYGIESVATFLDDVMDLAAGRRDLSDLAESRPTFAEGVISTAVLQAAHRSLVTGQWEPVQTLSAVAV